MGSSVGSSPPLEEPPDDEPLEELEEAAPLELDDEAPDDEELAPPEEDDEEEEDEEEEDDDDEELEPSSQPKAQTARANGAVHRTRFIWDTFQFKGGRPEITGARHLRPASPTGYACP